MVDCRSLDSKEELLNYVLAFWDQDSRLRKLLVITPDTWTSFLLKQTNWQEQLENDMGAEEYAFSITQSPSGVISIEINQKHLAKPLIGASN